MVRVFQNVSWALVVACAGIPALVGGCSSAAEEPVAGVEGVGSVGLELQVGSGLMLNEVSFAITGPAGFTKSGTLNVTNSTTLSGVISGLPAGSDFSITLSGTTTDGGTTCAGSASFSVTPHQTTAVSVHLLCHQAPTTGSVAVDGTFNVCPVVDGIMANPAEVLVGSTIAFSVSAHDNDNRPSPLSYLWTASSGTLSDATLASPIFTCTTPGTATVSVVVSDGDSATGCADQASLSVTCTPTAADVQAIANANCISCHSGPTPPRGLSLVDVKVVVGVPAVECPMKPRILSGNAAHSYLVDKILGSAQDGGCFTGRQMPLNKPPLSASDISVIKAWINAGTP